MRYQFYSQRWWDFPATLLLMAAMLTSATRLVVTEWTADLSIVQTLVFFGTLAGLAAGSSWYKPRTVGFIVTIYGLFMIPWQLGRTVPIEIPWPEKILVLINRVRIIVSQLVFREPV